MLEIQLFHKLVMPGLVPGIHVFLPAKKTWMAGTSPAMTMATSVGVALVLTATIRLICPTG